MSIISELSRTMQFTSFSCFLLALAFLAFSGNANPLLYLDISQDQIAMSSELSDDISTIQPDANETSTENDLDISASTRTTIQCFPYVSDLNSTNDNQSDKEEECRKQGCTWYPRGTGKNWESYCFTPKDYGYLMEDGPNNPQKTANGYRVRLRKYGTKTYFGNDSESVVLTVELQADYRLRFTFKDENSSRWEVPLKIHQPNEILKKPLYDFTFTNDPFFNIRIVRKSSGATIFDTSLGGLTISDQFLQITTKLASTNVYGFGEHKKSALRHEFKGESSWPMYSRGTYSDKINGASAVNLNGVHPYYTVLENDGNSHSVLIVNSNAQEIQFLPAPGLIYRTIGGILDFYVFMGPTPDETVQQFTEAVGRPFLPPYYALGLQVGKNSYSSLNDVKELLENMNKNEIPWDILRLNGEEFRKQNEQNSSEASDFIADLKSKNNHLMITMDPFIFNPERNESSEMDDNDDNMWIQNSEGNPVIGYVDSKQVRYPDFTLNGILKWWGESIDDLKNNLEFEAIDLVKNEPYNSNGECLSGSQSQWMKPSYLPKNIGNCLNYNTISADSQHDSGRHYDIHSLYGWAQSSITMKALQNSGSRAAVVSKSTFTGSGQWSGHTFDYNSGEWSDLHLEIIQLLQFNQFGIPYVGGNLNSLSDKLKNASDEFHLRWMQIQAFNPMTRVPDTVDLKSQSTKFLEGLKKVLKVRYNLLPYFYTLMYLAHTKGNTVVRPLWSEFRRDPITYDIDRQFLLGTGFLINPVLEQGVKSLEAYIPRDRWYDYYTGVELTERGRYVMLDAPEDKIPLLIRGYHIIPTQEPDLNTESSRNNNFTLIVALCAKGNGKGQLYFDDGISKDSVEERKYLLAKYSVTNKTIDAFVEHDGYPDATQRFLTAIRLLGAADVKTVTLNGNILDSVNIIPDSAETLISGLNLPINSNFTLTWTTGGIWY